MDQAKRARRPIRSRITKIYNEIKAEIESQVPFKKTLEQLMERLAIARDQLQPADQKVMEAMIQENKTDQELEEEDEKADAIQTKIRMTLEDVKYFITSQSPEPDQVMTLPTNSTQDDKRNFKLPKIELKKFNGEFEDWLGWWSQFSKIHEDKQLHEADKFHYLEQAMIPNTRAHKLVKSYLPTVENYPKVIEALQDRFGDKAMLAEVYIRKLQSIVLGIDKTNKNKFDLCKLYDEIETQLRCLESLSVTLDHSAFMLPLIESTLPVEMIKVWQRSPESGYLDDEKQTSEQRLKSLMKFLKREVKGEERIKMIQGKKETQGQSPHTRKAKEDDVPTAQSLFAESSHPCLFCGYTNHKSQDCRRASSMTLEQRNQKVMESRSCFKCLKKGHSSKDCKSRITCSSCKGRHNSLLCRDNQKVKNEGNRTSESNERVNDVTEDMKNMQVKHTVSNASQGSNGLVLLKTVSVNLVDSNNKKYKARLLFDDGSDNSYITTATAEKMKCPVVEELYLQTTVFGGHTSTIEAKKKYKVCIQSSDGKFKDTLQLINKDKICGRCPKLPKGPWMAELKANRINLIDDSSEASEIEILIGSNLWGKMMTGRMIKLKCGLLAMETHFGWTISGEIQVHEGRCNLANTCISLLTQGERSLPDMWKLETIGIKDPVEKKLQDDHNNEVKSKFKESCSRDKDGRYVVTLPWIDKNIPLPNNKTICERSLENLTRKLKKEDLFETYSTIFRNWEEEGIIEACKEEEASGHYLPHHRVLKPESKTTPVRPVFNASFKVGNHPSLNECMESGPNLLELIPSILVRFRMKDIGVISDIRKAFQMIGVCEQDKNYQKFLWWEDGDNASKIKVYQHARVVFGMNCSPFILAAALELHFEQFEDPSGVIELLKKSLYVDNSVLSMDSIEDYKKFRKIATSVLLDAKMELRQWESNCEESEEEVTSVLGLLWNKKKDVLQCKIPARIQDVPKVSKRTVLSVISQVYDPIGFTAPAVLKIKLMLQEACVKGLDWDESWNEADTREFMTWMNEVDRLGMIEIPRIAIGSHVEDLQLHLFTDASQDAYSAVIYCRVVIGSEVKVQLLQASSRVAPIKKISKKIKDESSRPQRTTIPRLELLGCLIGSRLLKATLESLQMENVDCVCWSDSTTALAWIRREENWGTFVGNRVREINKNISKELWRHVPGTLNPADLPSRGCSPNELLVSRWWEGPTWLYKDQSEWPCANPKVDEQIVDAEKKKTVKKDNVNVALQAQIRFSSFWKNIRVAAWIRRFLGNCKKPNEERIYEPNPTINELKDAEVDVFKDIQRRHFQNRKELDKVGVTSIKEDGLIHVKTRLDYGNETRNFKEPIILPSKDELVLQLIDYVHRIYCHAGAQFVLNKLRERYWILQGRRTVNKVIHKCVICRRFSIKSYQVDPAPLPIERITASCAFEVTGVDLAGPIYLKGGNKSWIVLYTCAVYRGVYLDIVDSLSAEEFLDSLHKFTCIIGRPSKMFSDNGTNFVGAQTIMKKLNWKKIEELSQVKQIKWRFNPPTAAWWGGWWERMIRTLKDLLRKMIGKAKLTRKQLATCLAEISFVINNRPLTTVTEDEEDLTPLTPAMFMGSLPLDGLPEINQMTSKTFQDSFKRMNNIKQALKIRFRKEYLGNLVQRKSGKTTQQPRVGDVVLVGYDNKKRYEWPLGRIVELFAGRDGRIRVARVRTTNGLLDRPLQRLYPLEVSDSSDIQILRGDPSCIKELPNNKTEENVEELIAGAEEMDHDVQGEQVSRYGRKIKKPVRYDSWFK